jgi:hypothetical protein
MKLGQPKIDIVTVADKERLVRRQPCLEKNPFQQFLIRFAHPGIVNSVNVPKKVANTQMVDDACRKGTIVVGENVQRV